MKDTAGDSEFEMLTRPFAAFLLAFLLPFLLPASARAAQCGGDFSAFLAAMGREAQAAGISRAVIDQAFAGVTLDPKVLAFDRRQRGTFRKSFEEYAATRVTAGRIKTGKVMMGRHAGLLSRVEQRSGVPGAMIVAIWGLESDYGVGDLGKLPVVRTIATLAHDCRRT
jgi:membrane-bound lytic murein transglycosylase B